jgi:hypothetical protein
VTVSQNEPSEYGGQPGLIQPEPHKLTAIEEARLMRSVDPGDPDDSVEAARLRGGAQAGGRSSQHSGPAVPGGSGS